MEPINKGYNMNKILVYGRQDCAYCDKTKSYLNSLNQEYQYIDITYWSKDQREELKKKYNIKTVPVILINGKCIGGYDNLIHQLYLMI